MADFFNTVKPDKKTYYRYLRAYEKTAKQHQMKSGVLTYDQFWSQVNLRQHHLDGDTLPIQERIVVAQRSVASGKSERYNYQAFQDRAKELIAKSEVEPLTMYEQELVDTYRNNPKSYDYFRKNVKMFINANKMTFDSKDDFDQYIYQYSD